MSWQNVWRLAKSDYPKLVGILALAFYLAFIPHSNYPYPVHIDEWVQMAFSKAMLRAGSVTFPDPFFGQSIIALRFNMETGFQLFWGVFQNISGISWLTIFKYFPGIVFMVTVLSVYLLARREGFGWEAALFTCLVTTTVGILGPGFLVPVALGLLFIPLSLFLAFNFRTGWSYLVLFVFVCFLLSTHAATAMGLAIILAPYILFNLRGNFKHSLGLTLALAIPFVAPFVLMYGSLMSTAESLLSPVAFPTHVDIPRLMQTYGYPGIFFCLLGTFLLVMRGGKKNYGLVFGLLALLAMLVVYFTFSYGMTIMYVRGLIFAMLMMGIVAGAGLMYVRKLRLPEKIGSRLKIPLIMQPVGVILCLALIAVTLAMGIPDRQQASYYHMIDSEDYEAFVWIRDNIGENYDKAILDPWEATAFIAITQKTVYARIHSLPTYLDHEAYQFLQGGCTETSYLRERGISIVYSRWSCNNPDLVEVRKNVYLLEEAASE